MTFLWLITLGTPYRDDQPNGSWDPTPVQTTIEFRDMQATYTFPVGVTTLWWYAPATGSAQGTFMNATATTEAVPAGTNATAKAQPVPTGMNATAKAQPVPTGKNATVEERAFKVRGARYW